MMHIRCCNQRELRNKNVFHVIYVCEVIIEPILLGHELSNKKPGAVTSFRQVIVTFNDVFDKQLENASLF